MPEYDGNVSTDGPVPDSSDERAAVDDGRRACQQALEAMDIGKLASSPDLLADSHKEFREVSLDLTRLAMIRETLKQMSTAENAAESVWQQVRAGLRSNGKEALTGRAEQIRDAATKAAEANQRRRAQIDEEIDKLKSSGEDEASLRVLENTRTRLDEMDAQILATVRDAFEGIAGEAELESVLESALEKVEEIEARRNRIRKRASRLRRISRAAHQLVLAGVGLILGVVAVQLAQEWIEALSLAAAWIFAIVAWAALDYVIEPRLRHALALRSQALLKDELNTTFDAWDALRRLEESVRLKRETSNTKLLPDWRTLTN